MKTLKLEVGKTYRSREGEEVKIVRKNNKGWVYWEGSNGRWYYEGGKGSFAAKEHPKDLIEEVRSEPTRHTFAIPNGVKKVTVEQVGNRIVVEMVPEEDEGPKPGDVMVNIHGNVYIFKEVVGSDVHKCYAWAGEGGRLAIGSLCFCGRPATPEEAQPLWDALKKAGKRWNPETMQVEEVPESDRIREWVEENLNDVYYSKQFIAKVIGCYLKHREGENETRRP